MVDKVKILAELDAICAEAKRLAFDETGWILKKEDKGAEVKKLKSPSFDGKAYRIETILDAPPQKVFDFLYPDAFEWDPHVEKAEVVDELSNDSLLIHHYMKPSFEGILKGRDAITASRYIDEGDRKVAIDGSVDVEQYPPQKGFVRSIGYPSGAFLEKTADDKTKMVAVIQADIKGSVPMAVMKKAWYVMIDQWLDALRKGLGTISYTPLGDDMPGRRKN